MAMLMLVGELWGPSQVCTETQMSCAGMQPMYAPAGTLHPERRQTPSPAPPTRSDHQASSSGSTNTTSHAVIKSKAPSFSLLQLSRGGSMVEHRPRKLEYYSQLS